jgi:hypothetical protein
MKLSKGQSLSLPPLSLSPASVGAAASKVYKSFTPTRARTPSSFDTEDDVYPSVVVPQFMSLAQSPKDNWLTSLNSATDVAARADRYPVPSSSPISFPVPVTPRTGTVSFGRSRTNSASPPTIHIGDAPKTSASHQSNGFNGCEFIDTYRNESSSPIPSSWRSMSGSAGQSGGSVCASASISPVTVSGLLSSQTQQPQYGGCAAFSNAPSPVSYRYDGAAGMHFPFRKNTQQQQPRFADSYAMDESDRWKSQQHKQNFAALKRSPRWHSSPCAPHNFRDFPPVRFEVDMTSEASDRAMSNYNNAGWLKANAECFAPQVSPNLGWFSSSFDASLV